MHPVERTIIEPGASARWFWRDCWKRRGFVAAMAWREVRVRYRQTALGAGWAILRPVLLTLALTVVFEHIARVPSGGVPYPLLVLAGLLPWQLVSGAMAEAGASVLAHAHIVGKVYFPRVALPVAAVFVCVIDAAVAIFPLGGLMVWYGWRPGWSLLALPAFIGLAIIAALGVGILLSALVVRWRDLRFVIPFMVQFGLFATPVGFASSSVPALLQPWMYINPVAGAIDGVRWSLFATAPASWWGVAGSGLLAILLLMVALTVFRNLERLFADIA